MKRTIAIILTIIMVIGLISTSIYAFSISKSPEQPKCTYSQHDLMIELGCICPICLECGHTYENGVCKYCGVKSPFETAPKCEHNETYVFTVEANCSNKCIQETYCKDCEKLLSSEILTVNENHVFYNGKCLLCGKLDVCNHDYKEVKREDATCTLPAYVWYECTIYGEEMNREEDITDGKHNYVVVKELAPTCVEAGYAWYECSVCGAEKNHEVGEALNHNIIKETIKEATYTENGEIKYSCDREGCDHSYTETIESFGHKFSSESILAIKVGKYMYISYICQNHNCSENITEKVLVSEYNK